MQFRSNILTRIIPVSTSSLPWLGDLIRFNFPFIYNKSTLNSSVFFLLSSSKKLIFFNIFSELRLKFFSKLITNSFAFELSSQPESFYPTKSLSSKEFVLRFFFVSNLVCLNFNLREFSPSFTAIIRTAKTKSISFYGIFFDFSLTGIKSTFFDLANFSKTFFSYKVNLEQSIFTQFFIFSFFSFRNLPSYSFFTPAFSKKFVPSSSTIFNVSLNTTFSSQQISSVGVNFSAVSLPFSSVKGYGSDFVFFRAIDLHPDLNSFESNVCASPLKSLSNNDLFSFTPFFYNFFVPSYQIELIPSFNTYRAVLIEIKSSLDTPYSRLFTFRSHIKTSTIYLIFLI